MKENKNEIPTYNKEIKVYINGKEIEDKIIPRNAGKLEVDVYL